MERWRETVERETWGNREGTGRERRIDSNTCSGQARVGESERERCRRTEVEMQRVIQRDVHRNRDRHSYRLDQGIEGDRNMG